MAGGTLPSPTLDVCVKENNTVFQATDTTGVYSVGNTGGYGSPNWANTGASAATITITYPDGSTEVINVLAELIAGTATGDIVFSDYTPTSIPDGIYTFEYSVTFSNGTVTYDITKLFIGKVRCCLDKLAAQVPDKLCSECETDAFIDRYLLAEGLYKSLIRMGGCAQTASISKVLTQLQKLCDFESCNCN